MRSATAPGSENAAADQPDEAATRKELERVLSDPAFAEGTRRRNLLRFLVEETLAGRGSRLKGFVIATDVFGRDEAFDAKADPVVRIEARRLRRDLDSYYAGPGAANGWRISIPKGGYAARFTPTGSGRPTPLPESAAEPEAVPPPRNRTWIIAATLCALAIVFLASYIGRSIPGGASAMASKYPGVAVEPFANAETPEADVARGLDHQVVADLMRFPDLRVYARAPEEDVPEDVRFVVQGTTTSSEDAFTLTARLIDVSDGRVLWSDTFEGPYSVEGIVSIQSEVASSIATAVGQPYGAVRNYLTERASAGHAPDLDSYECVLAGYEYRRTFADALVPRVEACLEATVAREPQYAEAWAMLAWMRLDAARFGRVTEADRPAAFAHAVEAALRGVTIDPQNGLAMKALAAIHFYQADFAQAEGWARRAVEQNPHDPDALVQLGWRIAVRGNFEEGIPLIESAIERSIRPPGWYFHLPAVKAYLDGDIDLMLALARRAMIDGSGISNSLLAIAQAESGDMPGAQASLERMASVYPAMWPNPLVGWRRHHASDKILAALSGGFARAGAPRPAAFDGLRAEGRGD